MKYLGNKTKLTDFLNDIFKKNITTNGVSLDLFSGTGNVSKLLTKFYDEIHSVDIMSISEIDTFVKTNKTPYIDKYILEEIKVHKKDGFVTNHFSSKVKINIFTEEIANHIDGSIDVLERYKKHLTKSQFFFIKQAILTSADFRSNIMGSYESFYKRGWRKQCLKQWDVNLYSNPKTTKNIFFKKDVFEFLESTKTKYGFIYADPPYNNRHYSSVFHVLETIFGEKPKINYSSKVNKPLEYFKSNFSTKRNIYETFLKFFDLVSKNTDNFMMSYNNEGIIEIKDLVSIANTFFSSVNLYNTDYRKFNTNNKNNKNNKTIEYIIHGNK